MVRVLGKVKGKLEYDISNCDARGRIRKHISL